MQCPKCHADFETKTYGAKIQIQRCTGCYGLFCQPEVLQEMRREWMSDAVLDVGDAREGKAHDKIDDEEREQGDHADREEVKCTIACFHQKDLSPMHASP